MPLIQYISSLYFKLDDFYDSDISTTYEFYSTCLEPGLEEECGTGCHFVQLPQNYAQSLTQLHKHWLEIAWVLLKA